MLQNFPKIDSWAPNFVFLEENKLKFKGRQLHHLTLPLVLNAFRDGTQLHVKQKVATVLLHV